MKRIMILVLALTMLVGSQVLPAMSQDLPRHAHLMLLHMEFDDTGEPVGFAKCIHLAGNRAVPLHAHHENMHFGAVGETLDQKANHWVIPSAGFPGLPWHDCDSFIEFILGE